MSSCDACCIVEIAFRLLQGVLRQKCVRLPEGVGQADFELWPEDEKISYTENESKLPYIDIIVKFTVKICS